MCTSHTHTHTHTHTRKDAMREQAGLAKVTLSCSTQPTAYLGSDVKNITVPYLVERCILGAGHLCSILVCEISAVTLPWLLSGQGSALTTKRCCMYVCVCMCVGMYCMCGYVCTVYVCVGIYCVCVFVCV